MKFRAYAVNLLPESSLLMADNVTRLRRVFAPGSGPCAFSEADRDGDITVIA